MRSDRANKNSNAFTMADETKAELDFLDGATAGSVVNSKAVIYGSDGELVSGAKSYLGIKKFQSFVGTLADIGDGTTQFADTDVLVELGTLDVTAPSDHQSPNYILIEKTIIGITRTAGTALSAAMYLSSATGTAGNDNITGAVEIVGAGVVSLNPRISATDSVAEIDIDMHGGNGHFHVFTPNKAVVSSKPYLYLCATTALNADATAGRFTVGIEYTVY